MKIYLSGPIQYAENPFGWREKMDEFFERVGHEAIMPWELAHQEKKIKAKVDRLLKNSSRDRFLDDVRSFMRKNIMRFDLDKLNECDAVLLFLPRDTRTAGSMGEVTLAYYFKEYLNRPFQIWVITDYRKSEIPYWVIGCSDKVFTDFDSFELWFKKKYNIRRKKKKVGGNIE